MASPFSCPVMSLPLGNDMSSNHASSDKRQGRVLNLGVMLSFVEDRLSSLVGNPGDIMRTAS
jgi:hypothetical protein